MKRPLALFGLFVFCLLTQSALAERDVFGLGTGRNGALTVSTNITINSYAQVTTTLAPGDETLEIGSIRGSAAGFSPGDLIMVWQATGLLPSPASGQAGPFSTGNSGYWEFARVAAASGSTLILTAPLIRSYPSGITQVIRVPEYTNLTINSGRQLTAYPWDGSCGGIIVFLATGTITNNGQINANAAGFRGGQYVNDMSGILGASGLDEAAPAGAQKGEGLANNRYGSSHTGYGNVGNAGGGGVALKSGGGGGGHAGAGGRGGRSDGMTDGSRLVGGLGGGTLTATALQQLFLGGGGGSGHGSDGTGTAGGRGGGVVFIRCNQLSGPGTITANGSSASSTALDGGSGGGAGGFVYLRSVAGASFGSITATGGTGSNALEMQVGPGGGGGGGAVLLQRSSGTGTTNVSGGAAGSQPDPGAPGGSPYGAAAGGTGVTTLLASGMSIPAAPTLLSPANGSLVAGTPAISGTGPANTTVELYLDNDLLTTVTTDASGNFSYTVPTMLSDGSHNLKAYAVVQEMYSTTAANINFTSSATLPLRLLHFGADKKQREVLLHWTTAEESNLVAFDIERSADGWLFERIGRAGASNTGGEHRYQFTDRQPAGGLRYYRLKIWEEKEVHRYSPVLTVQAETNKGLSVFPNPATEAIHLQLPAGDLLVQLVDVGGKTVYKKRVVVTVDGVRTSIDVRHMAPGLYYVLAGKEKAAFVKAARP